MNSRELIQIRIAEIGDHHRRGEYAQGYVRAMEALSLCQQTAIESETRRRVSVIAARSSYYVSRFDQALALCSAAENLLGDSRIPSRHRYFFECALIRANVLRRQGKLREALAVLEPYGAAFADSSSLSLVSEKLLIEGACWFYLNSLQRAEESLETALGMAINNGDSRMKSRVLTMLGLVAQNKGLHEAALEYFQRSKDICRLNTDNYGEAAAALDAGLLLYRRGRFSIAVQSIERAREIFASIQWNIGVCRSLLALGSIAKSRGDVAAAVRFYRDAERIAGEGGFAREQALAAGCIGDVHLGRGRLNAAETCYAEARRIASSIAPDGDVAVEIDRKIAEIRLSRGEISDALRLLRRGLRLSQKLGDKLEKGVILRCIGKAAFLAGARRRGCILFRKAIAVLREAGCDFEVGITHCAYAELLVAHGNPLGDGSLRGAPGTAEALDEAWASAVEAQHIFGMIESEAWKAEAERCIDRVIARRRSCRRIDPVLRGGSGVATISFLPAYVQHEGFVAVSEVMLRLWEQVQFAARFEKPVLVTGETGTGKELVARLVHLLSPRARRPFIALNCAAVPDHLFESEFFGHRRGCFTGALTDRVGLFEEADGGTLFLDEVGELTTLQQVKLLRVLQEGRVRRVGDNSERPVDVRIISATNQDLEERLGRAAMREDFYYRINAEQIVVPALRERPEDIVPLIAFCLCGNGNRQRVARIQQSAIRCLQRYRWPGNVRELFTVLERIKHISNGDVVTLDMLPASVKNAHGASGAPATRLGRESLSKPKERLSRALALCGGNKSAAARWLGISRGTLYKELRRFGLLDHFNAPPAQ